MEKDDLSAMCLEIRKVSEIRNVLEDRKFCKICLESDEDGLIDNCCLCKGTMGSIHLSCLERWVRVSGQRAVCPDCKSPYTIDIHVETHENNESIREEYRHVDRITFSLFVYILIYAINITWIVLAENKIEEAHDLTIFIIPFNGIVTGFATLLEDARCHKEDVPVFVGVILFVFLMLMNDVSISYLCFLLIFASTTRTISPCIKKMRGCNESFDRRIESYTPIEDD